MHVRCNTKTSGIHLTHLEPTQLGFIGRRKSCFRPWMIHTSRTSCTSFKMLALSSDNGSSVSLTPSTARVATLPPTLQLYTRWVPWNAKAQKCVDTAIGPLNPCPDAIVRIALPHLGNVTASMFASPGCWREAALCSSERGKCGVDNTWGKTIYPFLLDMSYHAKNMYS